MNIFSTSSMEAKAKEKLQTEINALLLPGEAIETLHRLGTDYVAITNRRVIALAVDLSITKVEQCTYSIPYKSISAVALSKETLKFGQLQIIFSGKTISLTSVDAQKAREIHDAILTKIC